MSDTDSAADRRRPGAFRRILFWVHLGCGVTAGLVILMMSVTGVLLTYERQMLAWAEQSAYSEVPTTRARLPLDELIARAAADGFTPSSVTVSANAAAPVMLSAGRRDRIWVDAYSGDVVDDPAADLRAFFATMTAWHRWFGAGDDGRDLARAVTGAANLVFLFLALSGLFLWLPKAWSWALIRGRLWFRRRYATAKARDFNWHHVAGLWTAVPLVVITATAAVFSYPWASDLVYLAAGEEPPARRSAPAGDRGASQRDAGQMVQQDRLPLQALLERADERAGAWNRITLSVPEAAAATVSFRVDRGNGGQPQLQQTLELDAATGQVAAIETFEARSAGARARSTIRFLHTGEVLGIVGQTIAGLASLAGAVLVWTGLALAYRRLLQPLLARSVRRNVNRITDRA